MKLPGPPSFRSSLITAIVVAIGLAAIVLLTGCTMRKATAIRIYPDGSEVRVDYLNGSVFGESSTDGVSITRQGEDYIVDIGPTSNSANAEELGRFLGGMIEGAAK